MLAEQYIYPFNFHRLTPDQVVAVSMSGDHAFLTQIELETLIDSPRELPISRLMELKSKFFVGSGSSFGSLRLLTSRIASKKETILSGPSLHVFVPTLQCAHSCRYCQVSRTLDATGHEMLPDAIDAACDTIFESPSPTLTVEFQGGDPLLRFDLIRRAISRISLRNTQENRRLRFVIASTLHQLTPEMCAYLKAHRAYLSTSIDGPSALHNTNRPLPTRDSYERTISGLKIARQHLGEDSVSALVTVTRDSLSSPEDIVDEYVKLGFREVFLRPLSPHGFARKTPHLLGYTAEQFFDFYKRAFERILFWNRNGVSIREVTAAILLNKILCPFDSGYVDLQSPSGAGLGALVYNYDGYVYPSDEARMLAEVGDTSLRLGPIGTPLCSLLKTDVMRLLVKSSLTSRTPGCRECAFNPYCGPDPIASHAQFSATEIPVSWSDHCKRHKWLFDFLFKRLSDNNDTFRKLAHDWAYPGVS